MSALTQSQPASSELDAMAAALRTVSGDLLAGYERLALRADRMERELVETNAELERKVGELDRTREWLEAILEALPCGVGVRDAGGKLVRVNRALTEILGREPQGLLGLDALPGLTADTQGLGDVTRPDGDVRRVSARRSAVTSASGALEGSVEIVDDRTELELLAERLHRVDKMAALGTMAGGLAHEIRNPMNAVGGFAELLLRACVPGRGLDPAQETKQRRWIEAIRAGVREVEGIIAGLLSLADPGRLCVETFAAGPFVEECLSQALRGVDDPGRWPIEVVCRIEELRGDRVQLRQALRNLVANAIHVQPAGGALRVELRRERDQLVLEVEDAGPGIPPQHLARVTDPFFTTRAEGTGLGLSLVHAIADLHGGALEIDPRRSSLGGARVRIRVPLTPQVHRPQAPAAPR